MDLVELQRRVSAVAKLDLAPHYASFRARGGADDPDAFLAYLGQTSALSPDALRELFSATDVDLGGAEAFAGTALGGFMAPGSPHAGLVHAPPSTHPESFSGAATFAEPPTVRKGPASGSELVREAVVQTKQPARFQTLSTLGQGAMGAIAIARDVQLRRKVALKTALPSIATHPQHLRRFVVEMQVTAQLEHPNIVPVYALDSTEGAIGYAMKLVNGVDLARLLDDAHEMIERGQPLDDEHKLEKRLEIFLKICDAIEFAHSKGVVHRDLKPANVMIGRHNEVYLMDWGIARLVGSGAQALDAGITVGDDNVPPDDLTRTRVGALIGTPPYMSPEQVAGKNAQLDGRSDQYTMGLILQECVTLKRAVDGTRLDQVLKKAMEAQPDPPPVGPHAVPMPRELAAIVRRATHKAPADRYPSMKALADDVRRYLAGEPVSVLPEGAMRKAGRWLGRHRMAAVSIVLGLALAGSVATIGALVVGQRRVDAEHRRQLRVSELEAQSAVEAQLVDHQLTRYEAALAEFVGATQIVLSKAPPVEAAPSYADAFAPGAAGAPTDLAPSIRYGKPVSVLTPVASVAPGVSPSTVEAELKSLGWLAPAFRALLIGSNGDDAHKLSAAEQRAAIADVGVPGFRAVVALKDGASLSFPGLASGAATDDREAPFYKLAEATTHAAWGPVTTTGKQASLPLSAALYDETGAFRGVALLEVSLDRLLARPGVAKIDYVQSRYLVDRKGKTVAEDSRQGGAAPIAQEVIDAIGRGESGTHEYTVGGHAWQYAYYPLAALDLYYVAAGDARQMIESTEKVETSDPRKVIAVAAKTKTKPKPAPAAAPAPTATATASAAPEEEDAGVDAGEPDAGRPDAGVVRLPGPMPTARPTATAAPAATPPAPSEAPAPPNPFEKWQVYKKPGSP
jgi:serine/threonine-protein kinase